MEHKDQAAFKRYHARSNKQSWLSAILEACLGILLIPFQR
jgi:hypothetical protein